MYSQWIALPEINPHVIYDCSSLCLIRDCAEGLVKSVRSGYS